MDGSTCAKCHLHGKQFTVPHKQSHQTHVLASQTKGPNIDCTDCHNDPLATATICDACHSQGGTYPGINGLFNVDVGAKANFKTGGIYNKDWLTLKPSKEKWCATCHDKSPSVINDVTAPNAIGNETAPYIYRTGYGFYKTGHGLDSGSTFPYSGGLINGPGKHCLDCHDASQTHTDGMGWDGTARTYGTDRTTGDETYAPYRDGYRLKNVGGNPPMKIPFQVDTWPFEFLAESDFALCFSCHSIAKFQPTDRRTRYRKGSINAHAVHLG